MAALKKEKGLSRVKLMEIKLNSLLEITNAINSNSSTGDLLKSYERILSAHLEIGKLSLYSHDNEWKHLLTFGIHDSVTIEVETELMKYKEIAFIDPSEKKLKNNFDIVIPVYHKQTPLAYVLIGDVDNDKLEVSPIVKHLPFIQTITNIIVVAVENKKLAKESIRQAALKKELELASEMQSMLFPTHLPSDEKVDINARYMPHQQVGGDYYDFIQLNENEIAFCVADVSGKGVAAALLMSNFQAYIRILLNHTTSLTELVRELNYRVMQSAKGEKFITLFIARYNLLTRIFTYVNAGHNPPVLYSGKTFTQLKTGTTGLGMLDDLVKVKEGVINLSENTIVVCYTDGVTELMNEKEEDFGIEKLKNIIEQKEYCDMLELNNKIIYALNKHKGNKAYIDDIALFSCRFF